MKAGFAVELINEAIVHAANAWWILPIVGLFCFIDGFLPLLPSETLLVALGVVAAGTGTPSLHLLILAGAAGAIAGDQVAYRLGRRIGTERFAWMRRQRTRRLFAFAGRELNVRGAMLIFTARYVPIGRVVVNLSSGATGFSYRRFTLLDIAGSLTWASYSVAIGVVAGAWFRENKLLGIGISVALAIVMGYLIDKVSHAVLLRLGRRGTKGADPLEARHGAVVELLPPAHVPAAVPEVGATPTGGS
ncbi:MAG: DedA family protein [Micrococcaceae bacterium]|nr:DedA family protein [Micrococcaceae bacterium]